MCIMTRGVLSWVVYPATMAGAFAVALDEEIDHRRNPHRCATPR